MPLSRDDQNDYTNYAFSAPVHFLDALESFVEGNDEQKLRDFLSCTDETGQNFLHILMKQPRIFEAYCLALSKFPDLFVTLIQQTERNGENPMHQFIAFGRTESLEILFKLPLVRENKQVQEAISRALDKKSHFDETPREILKLGAASTTIKSLDSDRGWRAADVRSYSDSAHLLKLYDEMRTSREATTTYDDEGDRAATVDGSRVPRWFVEEAQETTASLVDQEEDDWVKVESASHNSEDASYEARQAEANDEISPRKISFKEGYKEIKIAVSELQAHLNQKDWHEYIDKRMDKTVRRCEQLAGELRLVTEECIDAYNDWMALEKELEQFDSKFKEFERQVEEEKERSMESRTSPEEFKKKLKSDLDQVQKSHKELSSKVQAAKNKCTKLYKREEVLRGQLESEREEASKLLSSKDKMPGRAQMMWVKFLQLVTKVVDKVSNFLRKIKNVFSSSKKEKAPLTREMSTQTDPVMMNTRSMSDTKKSSSISRTRKVKLSERNKIALRERKEHSSPTFFSTDRRDPRGDLDASRTLTGKPHHPGSDGSDADSELPSRVSSAPSTPRSSGGKPPQAEPLSVAESTTQKARDQMGRPRRASSPSNDDYEPARGPGPGPGRK